jgi:hypothetical protein
VERHQANVREYRELVEKKKTREINKNSKDLYLKKIYPYTLTPRRTSSEYRFRSEGPQIPIRLSKLMIDLGINARGVTYMSDNSGRLPLKVAM